MQSLALAWATAEISTWVFIPAESSPLRVEKEILPTPPYHYGAAYYRDEHGFLQRTTEKQNEVAMNHLFVIGLFIGKNIHAIYDAGEHQIFLKRPNYDHVTRIPKEYRSSFVRLTPPTLPVISPAQSPDASPVRVFTKPTHRRSKWSIIE